MCHRRRFENIFIALMVIAWLMGPAARTIAAGAVQPAYKPPPSVTAESPYSAARSGPGSARDVHPRIRLAWLLLQALPSPGVTFGDGGSHALLSWQVTPFLYSWAMDPRLVPVRFLVVEPIVRQSGSIEWFVSPLYAWRGETLRNAGLRSGLRAYFPLSERGDKWSFSFGASAVGFGDVVSPSADLGIYTLFGNVGLLATTSPWVRDQRFEVALRVRYF